MVSFLRGWHQHRSKAIVPKEESNSPLMAVVRDLKTLTNPTNSKRRTAEWYKIMSRAIKTSSKIVSTGQMGKASVISSRSEAKIEN